MTRFLIRRTLQALVVLLLVTVIVFALLHALPGGPARAILGPRASLPQIEQFNHDQGFDQPLPVQYLSYLWHLLGGDLGQSYRLNQPVLDLLAQRIPKTLVLTCSATLLAVAVAVPLGVLQAVRRGRFTDHLLTGLSFLAYATPAFFLGLVLIILFAQTWPLLPAEAPQSAGLGGVFAGFGGLLLPICTLAAGMIAAFSRYLRSSVLDNLTEDYVRTARSKGQSERRVLVRHVLRNALIPVVTLLGMYLPALFGGTVVVESLFNYPGTGLLFWSAAQSSDFPVLLGVTLVVAAATVLGSLLADLVYALLDPRIRTVR
ncbi:ABC transporter permease [Kutzneria viridogrisea]|uniref:ABC transmembrane type-1 domain-containing protein n=2 Tax=Kutzneria TaxID=43356 RepID=W5WKT6_9PSEU|nr:ABC transporter permease [Kutzneria albida]AHI01819.1 hypothetical protein KALB_8462 [Kutzneria albida DSM 43870]MBA8929763.1 peptide/nickel transport system permease protein [Kutzneria viridogrisea]